MNYTLLALVISASVAFVFATHCPHNDISHCAGVACTLTNEQVGCEHDLCTCMPKPQACLDIADCVFTTCEKHDEQPHCIDGGCGCTKDHPH